MQVITTSFCLILLITS